MASFRTGILIIVASTVSAQMCLIEKRNVIPWSIQINANTTYINTQMFILWSINTNAIMIDQSEYSMICEYACIYIYIVVSTFGLFRPSLRSGRNKPKARETFSSLL